VHVCNRNGIEVVSKLVAYDNLDKNREILLWVDTVTNLGPVDYRRRSRQNQVTGKWSN
jgi:hypothetical protein